MAFLALAGDTVTPYAIRGAALGKGNHKPMFVLHLGLMNLETCLGGENCKHGSAKQRLLWDVLLFSCDLVLLVPNPRLPIVPSLSNLCGPIVTHLNTYRYLQNEIWGWPPLMRFVLSTQIVAG